MKTSNFLGLGLWIGLLIFAQNLIGQNYDDVAILINTNSAESVEVGEYFQQKHAIPDDRVIEMELPITSVIDSVTAEEILVEYNLIMDSMEGINYIVTTKGCPNSVKTVMQDRPDLAFESILKTGLFNNSIVQQIDFEPGEFDSEEFGFFIVSRLASKTLAGTFDLIDKGGVNVIGINDSLVIDLVTNEPAGSVTDLMEQATSNWKDSNDDVIFHPIKTDLSLDPYQIQKPNSGYFLFNFGLPDMDNSSAYQELVSKSYGLAAVITPLGALRDSVEVDISPFEFLEKNNYAVIGAVDYAYFTHMRRLMDVFRYHYNKFNPYNIGESFAIVEGTTSSSFVLFGDPKSTVDYTSDIPEVEVLALEYFPNPTRDFINVKFSEPVDQVELDIYTIDGRLVNTMIRSNQRVYRFSLENLPVGEYNLVLKTDNNLSTVKVVKI